MNTIVEIDKAGRIVVPKKLRDDLHLIPGTRLRIERSGERLMLMPSSPAARLVIEDGLPLIYPGDSSTSSILTSEMVREAIEQGRNDREQRILLTDEDLAVEQTAAWNEGAA
jgi:AbrB family looped-hinge helix DNA binding protein